MGSEHVVASAILELRSLRPDVLARIVPPRTFRYGLDGCQPSSERRRRLVSLLASEARRYLTVAGVPLSECPIGTLVAFTAAARDARDCLGCGQPLPPNAPPPEPSAVRWLPARRTPERNCRRRRTRHVRGIP